MTFDRRIWRWMLVLLVVLECLPFWVFRYFPSQDGPSHLHNAVVLADYAKEPIYQQYYRVTPLTAAGNLLTQQILAELIKLFEPGIAEKLVLTGYVVLMFVSIRYFLARFTRHADFFAPVAGIFVANWFLYKGFWNFSVSIPLLFLTLGYYVKQQQQGKVTSALSLLVLAGSALAIYMAHAVSWVICVLSVGLLGLPPIVSEMWQKRRKRAPAGFRKAILEYALPLGSVLPPTILVLTSLAGEKDESGRTFHVSLGQRLARLYGFSFLRTISHADIVIAKVVAIAFFGLFLFVLFKLVTGRHYNWTSTPILALTLVCALIVVAGPDHIGTGFYVDKRVALYAWLFFVVWLASATPLWSRRSLNIVAAVLFSIAVIFSVTKFPMLGRWNYELSQIVQVGQSIEPGSTVLMVNLDYPKGPVNPLQHAVGLLSGRTIVDLDNYEASFDYFTTKYQPDRSPFAALGTPEQLEAAPPVFNIARYETETRGRVDYVLVRGAAEQRQREGGGAELRSYSRQLAGFELVRSAEGGNIRLYQHRKGREQSAYRAGTAAFSGRATRPLRSRGSMLATATVGSLRPKRFAPALKNAGTRL